LQASALSSSDRIAKLERSVELRLSFALGHYTLGFVHSQSGDPRQPPPTRRPRDRGRMIRAPRRELPRDATD